MIEPSNDIELENLDFWPKPVVEQFKSASITSAQQLIAIARTQDGAKSLAEQAHIDEAQIRGLVERTVTRLGRMIETSPIDTSDYGLGVLGKPKQ